MYKFGRIFRRVDKTCGDLNIILIVFAIGLAVLDMTVFFTSVIIHNAVIKRPGLEHAQTIEPTINEAFQAQSYY